MSPRGFFPPRLLCVLVAVAFAVAAQPGAMAMTVQKSPVMSDSAMAGCDHMAPEKEKDAPAKSQAPCLGMLACFGMAALVGEPPLLPKTQEHIRTLAPDSAAPGLTHPPENPPPIA